MNLDSPNDVDLLMLVYRPSIASFKGYKMVGLEGKIKLVIDCSWSE